MRGLETFSKMVILSYLVERHEVVVKIPASHTDEFPGTQRPVFLTGLPAVSFSLLAPMLVYTLNIPRQIDHNSSFTINLPLDPS
jgi:hypothetical protein